MLTAGGNRQSLSTKQAAYPTQGGVALLSAADNLQLLVHSYSIYNATASAMDLGLGLAFKFGVGAKLATKVAAAVADAGSTGGATLFTTTNNDGFYVTARRPFGYLSFTVTQAATGSPVYTYQYWNGSTWTTLPTTNLPAYDSTGAKCLTFNPPLDWATGSNSEAPALSVANDGYTIKIIATTAPSQAVTVTGMKVAFWVVFREDVPAKTHLAVEYIERGFLMEGGEYLLPFFGTASAGNCAETAYQVNG